MIVRHHGGMPFFVLASFAPTRNPLRSLPMAQEMSFAQALTEAKQIIVQQSNRIKSDLEKIRALQETVASQTSALAASERTIREQADALAEHDEQLRTLSAQLTEASQARDQAETIID